MRNLNSLSNGSLNKKDSIRIALEYCGSCNPYIDLAKIGRYIHNLAEQSATVTLVNATEDNIDILIILCGCNRRCGANREIRRKARHTFVVAGESLDGLTIPEKTLAGLLEEKILAKCKLLLQDNI